MLVISALGVRIQVNSIVRYYAGCYRCRLVIEQSIWHLIVSCHWTSCTLFHRWAAPFSLPFFLLYLAEKMPATKSMVGILKPGCINVECRLVDSRPSNCWKVVFITIADLTLDKWSVRDTLCVFKRFCEPTPFADMMVYIRGVQIVDPDVDINDLQLNQSLTLDVWFTYHDTRPPKPYINCRTCAEICSKRLDVNIHLEEPVFAADLSDLSWDMTMKNCSWDLEDTVALSPRPIVVSSKSQADLCRQAAFFGL